MANVITAEPNRPTTTAMPLPIASTMPDHITLSNSSSNTAPGPITLSIFKTTLNHITLSISPINITPNPITFPIPNGHTVPDPTTLSISTINPAPDVTATSTAVNNAATSETHKLLTSAMYQTSTSPGSNSTSSRSLSASAAGAIVGVITGSAVLSMGFIVFCIMRYKRYDKKSSLASSHEASTSCDVLDKCRPQSTQFCPTPRPFLDFSRVENSSLSKGIFPSRTRSSLAKNDEAAIDPFKDPVHLEEGLSTNDDEDQRIKYTLDRLETITNQFEEDLRQLGALAQSGRLSAENRLRLEEIRHSAGSLMVLACDSRQGQSSVARNPSSGSSSSLPSYRTRSG